MVGAPIGAAVDERKPSDTSDLGMPSLKFFPIPALPTELLSFEHASRHSLVFLTVVSPDQTGAWGSVKGFPVAVRRVAKHSRCLMISPRALPLKSR